jgi:phosphoglycolate phosphatase-like HAD superfamily hydrolase
LSAQGGYYVGDTVDDMAAASRAGLVPIGITPAPAESSKQKALLLNKGAIKVFTDVNDIVEVLT